MTNKKTITIDGQVVPIDKTQNLLEAIRGIGIELPTFCYHSKLSVYGACRLCMVDIEGRGIHASCSTVVEPGMVIRTSTQEIRKIRKMSVELMLARHDVNCPSCPRSKDCKLQQLAHRLGVQDGRFKKVVSEESLDNSSPALVRDPQKCVLCGDCVRMCSEIQNVGAIDFAGRGHGVRVSPAFGKTLDKVDCVDCGQCAAVCPVGAIVPKSHMEEVWDALDDENKTVVVQIAPAVRTAIGESYGVELGKNTSGPLITALRHMGFDAVYDTAFAADLTVVEEATELLRRLESNANLPQFTSCCPAWVKFAEQNYPDLIDNLSTCRSPQQMFGSIAKQVLPEYLAISRENLVVVAIMPCTAKKAEAKLSKYASVFGPDVDHVLTTQEIQRMIDEAGLDFLGLPPGSWDMPLGFKTGAGIIFGASGGVSEAVIRFASDKLNGTSSECANTLSLRGMDGVRTTSVELQGRQLRLGVVHGLKNAAQIAEKVKKGEADFDIIEVMACPGGCVGGAGQPISTSHCVVNKRAEGLYHTDKMIQLHTSHENPKVIEIYENTIGPVGGETAHRLLHTKYQNRKRLAGGRIRLLDSGTDSCVSVRVCVGTNCYIRGAQDILYRLLRYIEGRGISALVEAEASFCFEKCTKGPVVYINKNRFEKCTLEQAIETIEKYITEETCNDTTDRTGCVHQ